MPIFVENDTCLVGGSGTEADSTEGPSVVLVTGANYSGKSVYLKQVHCHRRLRSHYRLP